MQRLNIASNYRKKQQDLSFWLRRDRSTNPNGRNNHIGLYLFIFSQNGFELGQDFIGRVNRLPGRTPGCPWSPEFEESSFRLVIQGPIRLRYPNP